MRASRLISVLAAALVAGVAWAAPPGRVVSINLCTDQLAMLVAAPGQLVSVSYLARDPQSSAMAEEAMAYPVNRSGAEEVYLLRPDLVIGGTYSTPGTVAMLRRLGVRVELLPPATSFAETAEQLREIGRLLGREDRAGQLVREMEARLVALPEPPAPRPRIALYGANGATTTVGSLSAEILDRAGFLNIADELELPRTGRLALERLILEDPDLIVTSQTYPGTSRAEAIVDHPAYRDLRARTASGIVTDADWVCGLPQAVGAVETLIEARRALEEGRG